MHLYFGFSWVLIFLLTVTGIFLLVLILDLTSFLEGIFELDVFMVYLDVFIGFIVVIFLSCGLEAILTFEFLYLFGILLLTLILLTTILGVLFTLLLIFIALEGVFIAITFFFSSDVPLTPKLDTFFSGLIFVDIWILFSSGLTSGFLIDDVVTILFNWGWGLW